MPVLERGRLEGEGGDGEPRQGAGMSGYTESKQGRWSANARGSGLLIRPVRAKSWPVAISIGCSEKSVRRTLDRSLKVKDSNGVRRDVDEGGGGGAEGG